MDNIVGLMLLVGYLFSIVTLVQWKGDTSIANFTWGGGVMLVALYTFFNNSSFLPQQIVLTTMIICWALRLIIFIYMRYTGKDPRFVTWKWQGIQALFINLIWVFGQTVMIVVMSYPVVLVNTDNHLRGLSGLDFVGLFVWFVGFCYEAVRDY